MNLECALAPSATGPMRISTGLLASTLRLLLRPVYCLLFMLLISSTVSILQPKVGEEGSSHVVQSGYLQCHVAWWGQLKKWVGQRLPAKNAIFTPDFTILSLRPLR
jgi:hypothetical protein